MRSKGRSIASDYTADDEKSYRGSLDDADSDYSSSDGEDEYVSSDAEERAFFRAGGKK